MTILTAEDAVIASAMRTVLEGDSSQIAAISCLGPTYVALRQGGRLQKASWQYSLDLGETFRAIVQREIPSRSTIQEPNTLELCFTYHYRHISPRQFRRTFSNIHVGIRGIELQYKDRIARYSPSNMIACNLSFQKVFTRFLEEASLSERELFRQGTIQVFEARQVLIGLKPKVKAVTMHRGNRVVSLDALSEEVLQDMVTTMGQWFVRQVQTDGHLLYKYFPSRGQEATSNNLIRQFMATLCLVRYARLTGRPDHQTLANHNLNYNLAHFYKSEGGLGFVEYDGKVKLGAIALAALAILEYADLLAVPVYQLAYADYFTGLCRAIAALWQPDGSFKTFLKPGDRNDNHNFYPGEALLFWASLYKHTQDAQLLERCQKSVAYYQRWHQQHRNPAFVPWHTQAYAQLYAVTGDRAFLDLIFEMNDWLLTMQQWDSAPYDDVQGRFYNPDHPEYGPPHASSTGVYLEGLADAYQLAVAIGDRDRAQCYQQVIWQGLRSVRQLQFRDSISSFYISQRSLVHGALRTTVYNNAIRIDNVQHCLMALMKLIQVPHFLQSLPETDAITAPLPRFPTPSKLFTAAEANSLKHFRLIDEHVNIQPFLTEIAINKSLWLTNTRRQDKIAVQRETNSIYLRSAMKPFPAGVANSNVVHESRQTQLTQYFPTIMQWLEEFARNRKGELGRATLVRLAPQGRVYRHIDKGEYYRIRDRYHLVLHSLTGSILGAGDEWLKMHPGECWWFNNKIPHEAYNESNDWRIHLIFDILNPARLDCYFPVENQNERGLQSSFPKSYTP